MLNVNELVGFGGGAGGPPRTTYVDSAYIQSPGSSVFSWPALPIGAEALGYRATIFAVFGEVSGGDPDVDLTVSANGKPATPCGGNSAYIGGNYNFVRFFIVDGLPGPTAAVVVESSGGLRWCGISAHAAFDLSELTPVAAASDTGPDAVFDVSIAAQDAGFVLAGVTYSHNSRTITWSGADQNFWTTTGSEGESFSAASQNFAAPATKPVTGTISAATDHVAFAAAWR